MSFSHSARLSVLSSVCLLFVTGCGGSDRPPLVEAAGIVTLDGEPVAEASVTAIPTDGGRPTTAITDAEGRFSLNTYSDDEGAAAGDYKVTVVKISGPGADTMGGAEPPEGSDEEDDGSDGLSNLGGTDANVEDLETIYHVPERYSDADSSGLTLTVPEDGSSELKLVLSK